MEKKQPTRASQAKKSDSTKVETQAKSVTPKERPKVWTPPSYLDTERAKWTTWLSSNLNGQWKWGS